MLKDNVVAGIKRQKENDLYNAVINGSEITFPDNLLAYYEYDLKAMYFEIAESYGVGVEEILGASGYTMEQFDADAKEYAKSMATRELVVMAISKAEGIELTDEEFQTEAAIYAASEGYESTEEFLEGADEDILKEDMLFNKIIKFIVSESKEI
jgi:trigger factor